MTVPYLTEERLRVLGFVGNDDLEELDSAQIRNMIVAASAVVDAYCNVPRLPQPFSFLGGTITDEEHDWSPGDALTPAQRRIFVRHQPLKAVTALRIHVTQTQYTDFDANELFVNKTLSAVEIVSFALTSAAPFGAFVLPNIGLQTPLARISYTYGHEFVADEILEPTDAKLYRGTNQFWDTDVEVVVTRDGTVVDESEYDIDYTEGTITFGAAQTSDVLIMASYGYTMPQDIAIATGYIVHEMLTEKLLRDKGMGGVRSLRVGEITIDRGRDVGSQKAAAVDIPLEAQAHLAPWRFVTVRG